MCMIAAALRHHILFLVDANADPSAHELYGLQSKIEFRRLLEALLQNVRRSSSKWQDNLI